MGNQERESRISVQHGQVVSFLFCVHHIVDVLPSVFKVSVQLSIYIFYCAYFCSYRPVFKLLFACKKRNSSLRLEATLKHHLIH